MNTDQSINDCIRGGPTSIQGSMNPNANHFVPRIAKVQHVMQVF